MTNTVAHICSTWTAVFVLPNREAVAVGSWPTQEQARTWGMTVHNAQLARLHDVIPLIHPGDLIAELQRARYSIPRHTDTTNTAVRYPRVDLDT